MILAIGFRVKSIRGTQFRKWANQNLIKTIEYMEKKEEKKLHYLLIGYANSKTLEDSKRQWKEILEHINLELDKAREEVRKVCSIHLD